MLHNKVSVCVPLYLCGPFIIKYRGLGNYRGHIILHTIKHFVKRSPIHIHIVTQRVVTQIESCITKQFIVPLRHTNSCFSVFGHHDYNNTPWMNKVLLQIAML